MDQVFADVPISTVFAPAQRISTLGQLVTIIVNNAFVLAGIVCFVLLIFGGFGVIVGAGGGDTKKLEQSKQAITGAVIGLLVIVSSFFIIQIIEKLTGLHLLQPDNIPPLP